MNSNKFVLIFILLLLFLILSSFGCDAQHKTSEVSTTTSHNPSITKPIASLSQIPTTLPSPNASGDNTSAVTPSPSYSTSPDLLPDTPYQTGDQGESVKLIQHMLITLGFDPGDADGVYGNQLYKAIKNFQLYSGLNDDGTAGQPTISALIEQYNDSTTAYCQSEKPLDGYIIGIDPGHQRHDNDGLEPVMPGSEDMKKKVSAGTYGRFTGVPEYVINLQVGLKLKKNLEALGAVVIMTRTTHDVNVSNAERAEMMNEAGVDCWLRIHANGTDDPETNGMFILVPGRDSMNTDDTGIQENSLLLAKALLKNTVKATGAKDLGIKTRTDQTGFGWSSVPVCNIEMGHMTNKTEDFLLVSKEYQDKIVDGICLGFLDYFKVK